MSGISEQETAEVEESQGSANDSTGEGKKEYDLTLSASSSVESSRGGKDPMIWGNIEGIESISKSPYEPPDLCAEVGEFVFDEVKRLLSSPEDNGLTVLPQAARLFGNRLAEGLALASFQIGKSGMVFSPGWQEGKIRGVQCGWIPKPLLLLCLHEQRFVRAGDAPLLAIIKDLGCNAIVGDAMSEWELDREFINLSSNSSYTYTKNKLACLKCEIFVARAFRAIKALKRQKIEPTLWRKITDCLKIMNEHVRVTKNNISKRLADLESTKNKEKEKVSSKKSSSAAKRKGDGGGDEKRREKRRKERRDSIDSLVGMFEEHSKRMQEILVVIKRKLKEDKEEMVKEIRQQVRKELLQEQRKNGKNTKSS